TPAFPNTGVTLSPSWSVSTVGGTLNSPLPSAVNNTAAQISATNVSIAGGATHTYTVTITFTVSAPATALTCNGNPNNGAYNAANISGGSTGSSSGCGGLPQAPALLVTKTNDDGVANEGASTSYTVTIVNNGNADATGVSWTDNVASGLNVTGVGMLATTGTGTNAGTCTTVAPWSCSGITIVAGGSVSYTVLADITGDPGTNAVNNANVAGGGCTAGTPSTPANCTAQDSHPIQAVPDLTPTFTFSFTAYAAGNTRDVIVNINEINGVATTGPIQFFVPISSGFAYTFSPSRTTASLFAPNDTTGMQNANWSVTTSVSGYTFTSTTSIPAGGMSRIVLSSQANSPGTDANITVTIATGSGGEVRGDNNSVSLAQSIQR
ncbi:MAG: hypothetical protein JSR65_02745, partial [Proteobacteria bacterium]|nr:hypothetical protein [Pseudomonadota bacterium]